jgi:hypothetical protein
VKRFRIAWLTQPKAGNYPAALSYLSLLFDEKTAAKHVQRLRRAPVKMFKSKDIFRASALSLLGVSNFFVEKDRKKILDGEKMSPILLVRDAARGRVIVADGYHRMCSVYSFDEEATIPCKIV